MMDVDMDTVSLNRRVSDERLLKCEQGLMRFPSTYSLTISLSEDQKSEVERRRKRERLAKLHRFLGSRIPTELILGPSEIGAPLPPADPNARRVSYSQEEMEPTNSSKLWVIAKRRNSLASSDPLERLGDSERMKEQLSDKEKAAAVKRALKMEKVGVLPLLSAFAMV